MIVLLERADHYLQRTSGHTGQCNLVWFSIQCFWVLFFSAIWNAGASDSGKSTCLNSLLAYTLGAKPLPEGAGKERQNTQLWRIEPVRESKVLLLDTPGVPSTVALQSTHSVL